jgi:hypothetical protein
MIQKYSVLGSCIAASAMLFWSSHGYAAGNTPMPPGPGAAPSAPNAASPQQEKWPTSFDIRGAQHAVFNFEVGAPGKITINIQSQGDPVSRFLVKPSGEPLFINNPASFEYVVTAADLSKGTQWKVDIYLAPGSPVQGRATFNPNGRASGGITILHPAAGNASQAGSGAPQNVISAPGSAAARVTDQAPPLAPVAFARPMLARRMGELTTTPIQVAGRFERVQQAPINHRPFTLADVFDLQSGKPLFTVDENTGELPLPHENTGPLPLPHGGKITVYRGAQSDANELQRRGMNTFRVGRGGSFRLGTEAGKQVVTVPRSDGTSVTVPAEVFLREINSYEQGLNAHGISLRDSGTGKIASTPRTLTVSRLRVDALRIKQQHVDHDMRIVKGVAPKSWGREDIFQLHQKAMNHIPLVLRGPNNRLVSAALPASAGRGVPHAASGNRSAAGTRSDQLGARVNQPLGNAPAAVADMMQKCAFDQNESNQPDGGAAGDVVTVNVTRYDPGACIVAMTDAQGRQVDVPSVNQVGPTRLSVTVPQGLQGMGAITLRSRTTPAIVSVPFFIGPECSLESVYPSTGMADTDVMLKVRRFKNCDLHFADMLGGKTDVSYSAVDGETVKTKVPNFSIGNDRIEAAKHPAKPGELTRVSSTLDFTIQRTVADQNGNVPPPDYFAQGLKPFERKYEWLQQYGDPSSFAVDVFAKLAIYSDGKTAQKGRPAGGDQGDNQVIFMGEGGATGWLFNYSADIVKADAIASVPTATSKDSKMRVNFLLTAGPTHYIVYQWKKNKDKDKDDAASSAQNICPDDQKVGGKCCDDIKPDKTCADDGAAFTAQIKYEHEYTLLNVDQSVETEFAVGPVPMVARFGFQGNAGAHVNFALSPLQAIGQVTPHVHTNVYGECGVSILFATAGVGADLTLADVKLDAAGMVYLDFGQMALVANMYVNYDYDLLDGTVYVFIDGFGHRVKQTVFDINELASQVSGQNLVFKGSNYLMAPQTYTMPLLSGS